MSFSDLSIDDRCLRVLTAQGITIPTPVQAETIPAALEGRDVLSIAQTGTGKTLAFTLPALTRLAQRPGKGRNRMLVLTPTRELANQVCKVLEPLAKAVGLRTACIYGGVGMMPQTNALRRGCAIIVATPGRLLDHIERGNVRFDELSVLVFDEADRMLDMGFMPDIKRILAEVPEERQTMLFSATFPEEIRKLTATLQKDPVRITIGTVSKPADAVRQGVYTVHPDGKLDLLTKLLRENNVASALVFVRTKHRTDRVAKALSKEGVRVEAIHGGRSQSQRERAIDGFRRGRFNVLVATDVASRGLDVQGITHVINFDMPNTHEDYIHRIGRTARASAEGDAISFVSPEDGFVLGSIERALGKSIPRTEWEGQVHVHVKSFDNGSNRGYGNRNGGGRGGYRGRSNNNGSSNGNSRNGGGYRSNGASGRQGAGRSSGASTREGGRNGGRGGYRRSEGER